MRLVEVRLGLRVWFWRRCRDCVYVQIAVLVLGVLRLHGLGRERRHRRGVPILRVV